MKNAIIRITVPDYQIGEEVTVHFKDTMCKKAICEEETPGKWIEDNRDDNDTSPFLRRGWKCSVCNERNTYGKPKFCMNCGVKMEVEE